MKENVIVVSERISKNRWNDALQSVGVNGTLFQSTYWADYLNKTFGDRPIYLASLDKKGGIQGLLLAIESCYAKHPSLTMLSAHGRFFGKLFKHVLSPAFHRTVPFIYWEHGPIIVLKSSIDMRSREIIFQEILGKIVEIAKSRSCYAIKFARPAFSDDHPEIFSRFGFEGKRMGTILIDLQGRREDLWKKLDRTARRNILKIEKEVEISEISNLNDLKDFYYLHLQATKRLKIKTYPFSYYATLWNYFSPNKMIVGFIAYLKNMPIGTSISVMYNNLIHEYVYGDSDFARTHKIYVNDLLKWNTIKWAQEKGFKYFDLSGVELHKIDAGDIKAWNIYRYKSKWGGKLVEYHDYEKTFGEKRLVNLLKRFLEER